MTRASVVLDSPSPTADRRGGAEAALDGVALPCEPDAPFPSYYITLASRLYAPPREGRRRRHIPLSYLLSL